MTVFVLEAADGDWGFLESRPQREDGSYLERTDTASAKCVLQVDKMGMGPDLIRTVGGIYLFSALAKTQIDTLIPPPDLHWVAVDVSSSTETALYFALVNDTRFNVIDRKRSVFRWLVPNKFIGKVEKWVLVDELLPRLDFFMAENGKWLITDRFVQVFADHQFTGLECTACET